MAQVTADRLTPSRPGLIVALLLHGSTEVFSGQLAVLDPADSGLIKDPADGSAVSGMACAGVVKVGVDNSEGGDGDKSVDIYANGCFRLGASSIGADDVGKEVYLIDNATVGLINNANSTGIPVGTIREYDADTGEVWVAVGDHSGLAAEQAIREFTMELTGVNATAFDLSGEAEALGGSDIYVDEVVSVLAVVTSSGDFASPARRVVTTHWTLAAGAVSTVGDETLNTWIITVRGRLLR